jgi:hypothetical protein
LHLTRVRTRPATARGPALLASAGLAAALFASPAAATECLERAANQVTVVPARTYTDPFRETPPRTDYTYDARGAEWRLSFTSDQKAFTVANPSDGACISGVSVVGTQSRTLDWSDVKNSDGVRFTSGRSGAAMTAEGLYVDNVGDAFEPMKDAGSAGRGYTFALRHSYFRDIRDDAIENDACHGGEVVDVLMDNTFVFISTRPGRGKHLSTGASAPVIRIYDSLIHANDDGGRLFKRPQNPENSTCLPEPVVDVRNTVFRVDDWARSATFPNGSYQNVTVVWTGGGSVPVPVPSGVTVTTDLAVWNEARAEWLAQHGCDSAGDVCDDLLGADAGSPPPDDSPPPPEDSSPPPDSPGELEPGTITVVAAADTYMREARPSLTRGNLTRVVAVTSDQDQGEIQALLRFDLAGRVPADATVESAILTIETRDPGDGADLHRMRVSWNENVSWDSFGDGVEADGEEALTAPDVSTGEVADGSGEWDVTDAVQAWLDGAPNNGWVLLPLGPNNWVFDSREGAVPPRLTVTYLAPSS